MDRPLKVGVITASVRENRQGEKVARWFLGIANGQPDISVQSIDLKEWPLQNFHEAMPPVVGESKYTDDLKRRWVETVNAQDAFVVVTPEYNHGYPGSLKNALDHAYAGWVAKPVAFVSYGGISGGVRAVEQLRQVAVELQMAPIRGEVNIPMVFRAFDAEGRPTDPAFEQRAKAVLTQLVWWGRALAEARERTAPNPIPTGR